jgi:hypothetical protein
VLHFQPGTVWVRGKIFRTRPDRPWGPPNVLYNGYRDLTEGKAAGAWRWTPTPSSAEVKERVELYLYSPSETSWPVLGWNLPLIYLLLFEVGNVPGCSQAVFLYWSEFQNHRINLDGQEICSKGYANPDLLKLLRTAGNSSNFGLHAVHVKCDTLYVVWWSRLIRVTTHVILMFCWPASQYISNVKPTWCTFYSVY